MGMNPCESNGSYEAGCFNLASASKSDVSGENRASLGVSYTKSQSLVLDNEKGELVNAPARAVKKNVSQDKAMLALKNHSEAERRRRQRINAHLTTLRGLIPCTDKMDKAALLAEVINQVKELKTTALQSIRGHLIPMDSEELTVEPCNDGGVSFRAALCCRYRPDLLNDLRQAVNSLQAMKVIRAEISTLEDWLKIVLLFTSHNNGPENNTHGVLASLIYRSLSFVLDKASASRECSSRGTPFRKRRKVPLFESLGSSP